MLQQSADLIELIEHDARGVEFVERLLGYELSDSIGARKRLRPPHLLAKGLHRSHLVLALLREALGVCAVSASTPPAGMLRTGLLRDWLRLELDIDGFHRRGGAEEQQEQRGSGQHEAHRGVTWT